MVITILIFRLLIKALCVFVNYPQLQNVMIDNISKTIAAYSFAKQLTKSVMYYKVCDKFSYYWF